MHTAQEALCPGVQLLGCAARSTGPKSAVSRRTEASQDCQLQCRSAFVWLNLMHSRMHLMHSRMQRQHMRFLGEIYCLGWADVISLFLRRTARREGGVSMLLSGSFDSILAPYTGRGGIERTAF